MYFSITKISLFFNTALLFPLWKVIRSQSGYNNTFHSHMPSLALVALPSGVGFIVSPLNLGEPCVCLNEETEVERMLCDF